MSNTTTDQTVRDTTTDGLPNNYYCPAWCTEEHNDPRHQYTEQHDHMCVIGERGEVEVKLERFGVDGPLRVMVYLADSDSTPFAVAEAPEELRAIAEFFLGTAECLEAMDLDPMKLGRDS